MIKKKKDIIGYTTGVFDLFHVGHLNILKEAKKRCDFLIVGVSTDELVFNYKNKVPVIPFELRQEIIKGIKYVDLVVAQTNMNKKEAWEEYRFDKIFVGEDWKNSEKWNLIELELNPLGVEVIYIDRKYELTTTSICKKIRESK